MAKKKKRVAWDKDQIVESLRPYFQLGYNIHKACQLARFPRSTFQTWVDADDELRQKVESWQGLVNSKARENIARKVQEGDTGESKWWLEKMDADFKPKSSVDLTNKGEKFEKNELPKELTDKLTNILEEEMREHELNKEL